MTRDAWVAVDDGRIVGVGADRRARAHALELARGHRRHHPRRRRVARSTVVITDHDEVPLGQTAQQLA